MIFALGFACGLIVGISLAWCVLTWFQPIDIIETGTFLFPIESSHVKKSNLPQKETKNELALPAR